MARTAPAADIGLEEAPLAEPEVIQEAGRPAAEVEHDPALGDPPEPKPARKPKEDPETKVLRAELAEEKRRRTEAEENARFWSGRARGEGAEEEETPAAEVETEATAEEDDLVDLISTKGTKGLVKRLAELGFVRQKDVDQKIKATRAEVSREADLFGEFPDLRKPKSEFFIETAREYQQLIRDDPSLKKSPSGIKLAARLAEARLKKPARASADLGDEIPDLDREDEPQMIGADDGRETETERRRRVRSQQGDRGGGRSTDEREPDELDSHQKELIRKFRDAGATDLTEEGYRKRAQSGNIRIAGMRPR